MSDFEKWFRAYMAFYVIIGLIACAVAGIGSFLGAFEGLL